MSSFIDPANAGTPETGQPIPTAWGQDVQADLEWIKAQLAQESVNTVAASGTAQTIPDVTSYTINYITLTANCTLTFPAAAAGKSFLLGLLQGTTGGWTVTWPGTVKWAGGTAPTLTSTAGKLDLFSFVCLDGTNFLGVVSGENF